jgi:hypothetical protein
MTKSGCCLRAFVDGTQIGSTQTTSGIWQSNLTNGISIGRLQDGTYTKFFPGYMDDFRLTRGVARYTANFTAPTAEFPLIAC